MMIDNITAEMDGSMVSCEYSIGQYGGGVEVICGSFSWKSN